MNNVICGLGAGICEAVCAVTPVEKPGRYEMEPMFVEVADVRMSGNDWFSHPISIVVVVVAVVVVVVSFLFGGC